MTTDHTFLMNNITTITKQYSSQQCIIELASNFFSFQELSLISIFSQKCVQTTNKWSTLSPPPTLTSQNQLSHNTQYVNENWLKIVYLLFLLFWAALWWPLCMVYGGYCCSNDQAYNFNWEILSVVIVTQLCCLYNGSMVCPPPSDKCTSSGHQLQVRTARFPVFCSKLNWSANLIFTNWNYDINLK